MAEFWVDLVAAAFGLPSTKEVGKQQREYILAKKKAEKEGGKAKISELTKLKTQDPTKLANALGDGTKGALCFQKK